MKFVLTLVFMFATISAFSQNSSFAWYFEGNKQLFKKNYDAAIEAYNKTIEMDENADYAYFNRGNAKFEQEDYAHARLDYNKTIQMNDEYAEAYFGRGRCKIFMGDTAGGCKDLKIAKKMEFRPAIDEMNEHCQN